MLFSEGRPEKEQFFTEGNKQRSALSTATCKQSSISSRLRQFNEPSCSLFFAGPPTSPSPTCSQPHLGAPSLPADCRQLSHTKAWFGRNPEGSPSSNPLLSTTSCCCSSPRSRNAASQPRAAAFCCIQSCQLTRTHPALPPGSQALLHAQRWDTALLTEPVCIHPQCCCRNAMGQRGFTAIFYWGIYIETGRSSPQSWGSSLTLMSRSCAVLPKMRKEI